MNINQRVTINNVHLCLENFSKALDEKRYIIKVEYKIWRKLSKAQNIELNFDSINNVYVHVIQADDVVFTTTFTTYDNGFGQYLFDTYYSKEAYMDTLNATKIDNQNVCYIDNTTIKTNWDEQTISYNQLKSASAIKTKKEENNMNTNKILDFNFGFITDDSIRFSPYGLAIKNQVGTYVSYDAVTGDIIDVEILNFKSNKMFMKMPVSIDDIQVGNILIHNHQPVVVTDFANDTGNPIVINIYNGTRVEILPTRNMFHFNYYTKIISLMDMEQPSTNNPFGNMWMFALLDENSNFEDMMLPLMMMNGQLDMNNPLMMYFMVKDDKDSNMLPLILMMNQQKK